MADGSKGPPPLPLRKRIPPAASGIASDAQFFEAMGSAGDGSSLDSRWLYQSGGHVFGPVPARELLEMLYDGGLDFETPVSPEDGDFRPARRYGVFAAHQEKVERHRDQIRQAEARVVRERRRRARRTLAAVATAGVILVVGGVTTRSMILAWRQADAERARAQEEERLREQLDALLATVTVEPPLTPLIDGVASSQPRKRRSPRKKSGRRRQERAPTTASGPALSDTEILQGVAKVLPTFKRCIVEQMQRSADSIQGRIVLQFTIGNDGRARNFRLADRHLHRSPLEPCLASKMRTVTWRPFRGEVRNVEYPIRVQRSG